MNKIILIVAVVVLVSGGIVWADSPEIPKAGMIAYSSGDPGNAWGWLGKYAIDGNFSPPEWQASAGPPQWLRLDLGSQYTVQEYGYARRTDHTDGYIKDFEIYVTDSDSLDPADWDAPVHVGTMPSGLAGGVQHRFALGTPSVGRYVILIGINSYTNYIGAGEVWVYGTKRMFIVANQATGNYYYTASPTVDVVRFPTIAEPEGEMFYAITETDGEPVAWETAVPPTYTFAIPDPAGPVDLWGWVKDSADPPNIISEQIQITYATWAPTANAKNVTVAFIGTPVSIPAAAFDNGSVDDLGIHSFWASSPDDETPEESCVTFSGLGTYDVTLTVTNELGIADAANCTATLAEPWAEPIDADLTWSGATSEEIDVHRNGAVAATTENDGAYTDKTGVKGGGTAMYRVCEAGTTTCSNEVTVTW